MYICTRVHHTNLFLKVLLYIKWYHAVLIILPLPLFTLCSWSQKPILPIFHPTSFWLVTFRLWFVLFVKQESCLTGFPDRETQSPHIIYWMSVFPTDLWRHHHQITKFPNTHKTASELFFSLGLFFYCCTVVTIFMTVPLMCSFSCKFSQFGFFSKKEFLVFFLLKLF